LAEIEKQLCIYTNRLNVQQGKLFMEQREKFAVTLFSSLFPELYFLIRLRSYCSPWLIDSAAKRLLSTAGPMPSGISRVARPAASPATNALPGRPISTLFPVAAPSVKKIIPGDCPVSS
jgi:hypothetical protein